MATITIARVKKGYAHRNSLHKKIEEPEVSDPEFTPGPVPLEETRTVGRKRKAVEDKPKSGSAKKQKKKGVHRGSTKRQKPSCGLLLGELELTENPLFKESDDEDDEAQNASPVKVPSRKNPASNARPLPAPVSFDSDATEPESDTPINRSYTTQPKAPAEGSATEAESDSPSPVKIVKEDPLARMARIQANQLSPLANAMDLDNMDGITEAESDTCDEVAEILDLPGPEPIANSHNDLVDYNDATEYCPAYSPKPSFTANINAPLIGPMTLDTLPHLYIPSSINRYLRSYQKDGVRFFYDRYKQGRGGILGDDMGLGKTIQVISFLTAIMGKRGDSRDEGRRARWGQELTLQGYTSKDQPKPNSKWPTALIVAPGTLIDNWIRELETWGYFEVGKYHGKERAAVLGNYKWGRYDILITSFVLATKDVEKLSDLDFSVLFADEAHQIKSATAETTQAMKRFQCTTRFGLTGTAIQNSYMEFWQLLDWSNPMRLGTALDWMHTVVRPLTKGQSKDAEPVDQERGRLLANGLVNHLLPKYFLRRTKALIADQMPKKYDHVVFCPLTGTQIKVYKRFLKHPDVWDLLHKDDPCDCGSKEKRGKCCHLVQAATALKYMTVLIKISNSLMLLCVDPNEGEEQRERNRELSDYAFEGERITFNLASMDPELCGKWKVLDQLLDAWKEEGGNKILIFSKSVKLLKMLDWALQYRAEKFHFLHGGVLAQDRMKMVDSFNNNPEYFVFLISTMTGGVGLNLTSANKVVIFDPNWNPAHDLQAMDRAYRFGQTRDVHVYRLLGAGSLEELIYARQLYKQQQMKIGYEASLQTRYFTAIQGDKHNQGELFGMKNIFRLHEGIVTTQMTIETAQLQEQVWRETLASGATDDSEAKMADFLLNEDDATTGAVEEMASDPVMVILQSNGVQYTHENTKVLEPSRFEAAKLEIKKRRSSKKKTQLGEEEANNPVIQAKPVWPPVRKRVRRS